MVELWRLMDTPVEEQQAFQHVTCHISASEDEIIGPSSLSVETIEEVCCTRNLIWYLQQLVIAPLIFEIALE